METDAEIHSLTLGQALGVQLRRGRRDHMSKRRKFTEITDMSLWELIDSGPTARELAWNQHRSSACA